MINLSRMRAAAFMGLISLMATGCLYTNVRAPRAYRSATPADVKASPTDPIVSGESCMTSVLFLVAWGNAGYAAAADKALKDHPDAILYDVRADQRVQSILGLYARSCTIVTGKAAKP